MGSVFRALSFFHGPRAYFGFENTFFNENEPQLLNIHQNVEKTFKSKMFTLLDSKNLKTLKIDSDSFPEADFEIYYRVRHFAAI